MKISRRGQVPPFIVMDVMTAAAAREKSHGDVLHLEVGQPSTPAPAGVLAAAQAALTQDKIGYTVALGIPPLRQAIASHYGRAYGTAVKPERVVVTTGSSGAFLLAFLAAFDVGDRVALAAPGYPAYRNILTALGIEAVEIPAGPDTRYQPTPELLEKHGGRLDGLIIASPANPTGTMLSPEALADLTAYCESKSIRLVSDEIYHGITYGMGTATALQTSGSAIIVNSFSKYYSMTGWRLGWLVLPEDMLRPVECLAQNLYISPPTLSQYAAVAAFDCGEELDRNVARYARNRGLLLEALPRAGFDRLAPADGAFYLYAEIGHLTNDSVEFCRRMLAETGVAATPGVDFDPVRGHATMRFSFAGATEEMEEAAARLHRWLR
ncbi:aminotransferase class I/II-fold pyridoxal phosphate-dependent enzyme [Inquilinus limosus]|uniref:Aminotransferase n=1 Tax=Inquilinus limosus MP06 TaxID=1398085 RepID=A0A0A0D5Y3_9PROT|nr:aminotransferase class I/II-fold pyridoxal phosphate-dependent enzyme [Inquilinus limosus]KGM34096.1 1-aminocyclopropane-1-carboxylate deaminase [Inquilinus limosus MP06]